MSPEDDLCHRCNLPMRDWRGRGMECMACMINDRMRKPDPLLTVKIPHWVKTPPQPKG